MRWEYERVVPNGGTAANRGSIHLSFRSGSRGRGASAAAAFEYVSREGDYSDKDLDPAVYVESDHMPAWAAEDPREYWDAADLYERANGRLYVSADFALPRELDDAERIELARAFAHELTDAERLPYTLSVHAGLDEHGQVHNPHAHLMFSERRNDDIERPKELWFRRADARQPERGGAPKSRTFHGSRWVEDARAKFADRINSALDRQGRANRVDHRSYARQGIEREPGRHFGPDASRVFERGTAQDRLEQAVDVADRTDQIKDLDQEIAGLEIMREQVTREAALEDRGWQSSDSQGAEASRAPDDSGWER